MLINIDTIIKDDDSLIREKSLDVPTPLSKEDEELVLTMLTYVKESTDENIAKEKNLKPAVGISAIQLGIKKKLMAIYIKDEEDKVLAEYALANPKIVSYSVENAHLKNGEGCLSVPGEHRGIVNRHNKIKIKAYDAIKKEDVELRLKEYESIVFQHEIDHFNGILFYDHINKDNPMYVKPNSIEIE